ncbi:MAG: hypothetical protein WCQ53_03885 [bacterium]
MSYLFLLLLMSFNAVMPVTVLEKVENSPFLCNVNANCSGSIVKYKNSLFLFTANHCMTFKQDKVFCAYKDDGTYDYTVELLPSVLSCSGATNQAYGIDDFAIYGIDKIYSKKASGKTVDKSLVPALVLPDPELNDINQTAGSYFEDKAGQSHLKDAGVLECRAAGFGRLISGEEFGTLRSTKIPKSIQNNTVTSSNWIDSYFVDEDKNKMILYKGDSGGPLYCRLAKDASSNWYILGVAAGIDFLDQKSYDKRHYNTITNKKDFKVNSWSSTINDSFINATETAFFQSSPTACTSPSAKELIFEQTYSKKLYASNKQQLKVDAFRSLAEKYGTYIMSKEDKTDGKGLIATSAERYLFINDATIEEDGDNYKIIIKYTDKPTKSSQIAKVTSKTLVGRQANEAYYSTISDFVELEFINSNTPKITMKDFVIVPNIDKKLDVKKDTPIQGSITLPNN